MTKYYCSLCGNTIDNERDFIHRQHPRQSCIIGGRIMVTCKDCIHYEPCKDSYYNAEQLSRLPLGFLEKENAEKNCAFFEDRSKIIELPCNIDDTVYIIYKEYVTKARVLAFYIDIFGGMFDLKVQTNELKNHGGYKEVIDKNYKFEDFGKVIFMTKEEAEKALKEREKE